MSIWIDLITAHDAEGKVVSYFPECHWNLDEHDTVSPSAMNEICEKVRREVEVGLALARVK